MPYSRRVAVDLQPAAANAPVPDMAAASPSSPNYIVRIPVANALQHGEAPVSVVAQEHGDEVVLQVHNEGPPIPASALKKIFEPLVRQPTENDDKNATGLGLGLYIAREVVTAHGGTIGVISTEKEGTTFTVQIPRRPSGKKPQQDRTTEKAERPSEQQPAAELYRSLDRRMDDRRHSSPQSPS